MAVSQNFVIYRGDTLRINVAVTEDGSAKDLADALIFYGVSESIGGNAVYTLTLDDGITITDEPGGLFTIINSPENTVQLAAGQYHHEAKIVDANDIRSTVLLGNLTLKESILK